SGDILGEGEMRLVGAVVVGADALDELFGGEQAVGLVDLALAVDPLGLYGVQPRALRGQEAGEDAHALARPFHLAVVGAEPGAGRVADVPGGVVPEEEQRLLS